MNKDSIYRIIGYNGEYTESIKKALRRLLKENHPDHNGDKEVFKIINDVKDELENNQVSFKYKKNKDKKIYDDIDYSYCSEMINKLTKEKNILENELQEKKDNISSLNQNYHSLYRESIEKASNIINNDINKLNNIKKIFIIILIVLIGLFLYAILNNSIIFFVIFGIISFIFIIILSRYFTMINEINTSNKKKVKNYVKVVDGIKSIIDNKQHLLNDEIQLERKIKKIENDLRFYKNLLK